MMLVYALNKPYASVVTSAHTNLPIKAGVPWCHDIAQNIRSNPGSLILEMQNPWCLSGLIEYWVHFPL